MIAQKRVQMCADLQICARKLTSLQIPDIGRGEITRIFSACYLAILPIQDRERVGECYRKEELEKVEHKKACRDFSNPHICARRSCEKSPQDRLISNAKEVFITILASNIYNEGAKDN